MNEKPNHVFSLKDESTTVTTFSVITKKYSIGNADLSGTQSFFSKKYNNNFFSCKIPIIISENIDLSICLKQVYSL